MRPKPISTHVDGAYLCGWLKAIDDAQNLIYKRKLYEANRLLASLRFGIAEFAMKTRSGEDISINYLERKEVK